MKLMATFSTTLRRPSNALWIGVLDSQEELRTENTDNRNKHASV